MRKKIRHHGRLKLGHFLNFKSHRIIIHNHQGRLIRKKESLPNKIIIDDFCKKQKKIHLLHETNCIRCKLRMIIIIVISTYHIISLSLSIFHWFCFLQKSSPFLVLLSQSVLHHHHHRSRQTRQTHRLSFICQSLANEDVDRGQ